MCGEYAFMNAQDGLNTARIESKRPAYALLAPEDQPNAAEDALLNEERTS